MLLADEVALQRITKVFEQMPPICYLFGSRCSSSSAFGIDPPRSRLITCTPGCCRSQLAKVVTEHSGKTAKGRRCSRSHRIVP